MKTIGLLGLGVAVALGAAAPELTAQGRSDRATSAQEREVRGQAAGRQGPDQGQRQQPAQARGQGQQREQAQQARPQGQGQQQRQQPAQARGQGQQREQAQQARPQGQGQQQQRQQPAQARGQGQAGQPGEARSRPQQPGQARRGAPETPVGTPEAAPGRGNRVVEWWRENVRRGGEPTEHAVERLPRDTRVRALVAAGIPAERTGAWVRGDDWREDPWELDRQRDDRWRDVVIRPSDQRFATRGGAPAFCRSGEGHPVWGRQWCLDMGFGLGHEYGLWGTARMDGIVFREPRFDTRDRLTERVLSDVLGGVVFGRLETRRSALGVTDPLVGYWAPRETSGAVLFVNAGTVPIAEFVDRTGDGRVDLVVLNVTR
jgi:hypothetical protein